MTKCVACLIETPLIAYLGNDMLCDGCNETPYTYPLASTPEVVSRHVMTIAELTDEMDGVPV